jgi:RimJ/RimL family protein N-acetyltransferase
MVFNKFLQSRHIPPFFALAKDHPGLWAHVPAGPFSSEAELADLLQAKPPFIGAGTLTYAVIDTTRPATDPSIDADGQFAGMISYMNSNFSNRATEIAAIFVLPPFQRTHVTTNAVGLMLQHAFKPASEGGLDLVRVSWQTGSTNAASLRLAERFGFQREGLLRWHMPFRNGQSEGKQGNGAKGLPPGSEENDLWRDTVVFGLCWDDWAEGGAEKTLALMERR